MVFFVCDKKKGSISRCFFFVRSRFFFFSDTTEMDISLKAFMSCVVNIMS